MKIIPIKPLAKFILGFFIISLFFYFLKSIVLAGGISQLTISMYDSDNNAVSGINQIVNSMIITFDPDNQVNSNDGIKINFQSNFDISEIVNNDVAISQINGGTNITKGAASVTGQDLYITIASQSDNPSGLITITISNGHIVTPTAADTYIITITTYDLGDDNDFGGIGGNLDILKDQGSGAVIIADNANQVTISATVSPSISFTTTSTLCDLGTFDATKLKTCSSQIQISTNAATGYRAYIKADGDLRNSINSITNVSGGNVSAGTEGYGISTTLNSQSISRINDANNDSYFTQDDCTTLNNQGSIAMTASALTVSDQSFASASGPVASDSAYLCYAVAISGTTPAGIYSQLVTITIIGNF